MMRSKLPLLLSFVLCLVTTPLLAADPCNPAPPKANSTVKKVSPADADGKELLGDGVSLGSWVAVEVENLAGLQLEAKCAGNKKIVVYLNGRAAGLVAEGLHSKYPNILYFRLWRTPDARMIWNEILSAPDFGHRRLDVTIGIDGQVPLPGTANDLGLKPLDEWWAGAALIGFLGLLGAFFSLALKTNVLRDGTPSEDAVPVINGRLEPTRSAGNRGTYSLAKLQGAWWLFIILGAYLLIGLVTWDFYTSLTSTALILLGISSGTVIGGTVIDASQTTPEQKKAQDSKAAELRRKIDQLTDAHDYVALETKRLDNLVAGSPFAAGDEAQLNALITKYGPSMPKWLNLVGEPFSDCAAVFELIALGTPAAGGTDATRQAGLQAKNSGELNDLCELAVLKSIAPPPATGTPNAARLDELVSARQPTSIKFASFVPKQSDVDAQRVVAISRYKKLTGQSEAWFIDVLSDANGVSLHRFQLFAWTAVLGIVFIVASYRNLAMPIFDTTLMGLLGLSAGTYLGLKIPEATVPK